MSQPTYWVVVASRDYSLKRMYGQAEPYQRFIALGEVSQGPVFQAEVSPDFRPFRRQVSYQPVNETPIQPLLEQLTFIQNKVHWGAKFRFGCFPIPAADFALIRSAMTPNAHE
ncbi:hypothetical protein BH09BAC4_BH09BAC4_45150 [soil metagenome]